MISRSYERETSEFDRGLAFFDAIYAFALTLLIANLDVPPAADWGSLETLLANGLGWQLVAFVISVVVIVMFWRNNTAVIARLGRLDSAVITANIVLACIVIFLPFTTQAMGDPETADLVLPTVLYAVNVALGVLAQIVMTRIAIARGLEREPANARDRRAELVASLWKPLVFLGSIPVAYAVGPGAAKAVWLLTLAAPLVDAVVGSSGRQLDPDDGPTTPVR